MTAATQPGLERVVYTSAGKAGHTALRSSYAGHCSKKATQACSSQHSQLTFLGSAFNRTQLAKSVLSRHGRPTLATLTDYNVVP
jgi:hypothetical protein